MLSRTDSKGASKLLPSTGQVYEALFDVDVREDFSFDSKKEVRAAPPPPFSSLDDNRCPHAPRHATPRAAHVVACAWQTVHRSLTGASLSAAGPAARGHARAGG